MTITLACSTCTTPIVSVPYLNAEDGCQLIWGCGCIGATPVEVTLP